MVYFPNLPPNFQTVADSDESEKTDVLDSMDEDHDTNFLTAFSKIIDNKILPLKNDIQKLQKQAKEHEEKDEKEMQEMNTKISDNSTKIQELIQKADKIAEIEETLQQLQDQVDTLEAMQKDTSDKSNMTFAKQQTLIQILRDHYTQQSKDMEKNLTDLHDTKITKGQPTETITV